MKQLLHKTTWHLGDQLDTTLFHSITFTYFIVTFMFMHTFLHLGYWNYYIVPKVHYIGVVRVLIASAWTTPNFTQYCSPTLSSPSLSLPTHKSDLNKSSKNSFTERTRCHSPSLLTLATLLNATWAGGRGGTTLSQCITFHDHGREITDHWN